jgi:hypothetical protein
MRLSSAAPALHPRRRRRFVTLAASAALLAGAFAGGMQLKGSASYAAIQDSCTPADFVNNHTVMTKDTHLYNCHPSTGNALPTGGVIGTVPQGSNPAVTARWWNTVAVDGDGGGSACLPSAKWLRGSGLNWWSASCTQAP